MGSRRAREDTAAAGAAAADRTLGTGARRSAETDNDVGSNTAPPPRVGADVAFHLWIDLLNITYVLNYKTSEGFCELETLCERGHLASFDRR